MLYGLNVLEWLLLIGAVVGGFSVLVGLVLAILFWWRPVVASAAGGGLKVKVLGIEISLGTFAAAPLVLGLVFLGCLVYAGYYFAPAAIPIKGTVKLTSTRTIPGITVAVLPSNHLTQTQPDGTFKMIIPKQSAKGVAYQAVIYMPNTNPPVFHLGVVRLDADGEGSFDHTLAGGR